jgi:UDP-N-acetylmuramate--alanine ligase
LRRLVSRNIVPGDLVLTLGAGDIHRVASKLAEDLASFEALRKELKPESVLLREEPLSKHTSLRVGGPADLWFEPVDEEDLAKGLRHAQARGIPVTLIGRGTNLLVRDGGIRGLCIHLGQPQFTRVKVDGLTVEAGSGARLKNIVAEARKNGVGGLEFMEGIPGNLGGALRMNAGAMQGWTMSVVEEIRSMSYQGEIQIEKRDNLEVRYRNVPHFEKNIALSAKLRGVASNSEEINERLKKYSEKRWHSQPAAPSAGCIFKNPETIPAGKLIDELGLKNRTAGKARVSEVHGNFIVNDGGATARDMLELIDIVKREAKEKRQIELETEVITIGEDL